MPQHPSEVFIAAARRVPIGTFLGGLAEVSATELGAAALRAVMEEAPLDAGIVEEVLMGCVLAAGLGQAPARQAARGAGVPDSAGCTTVNKVCGSGMKAVMLGHDLIRSGSVETVLAGGMESMSRAPYLLTGMRRGWRFGHQRVLDHLYLDGLEDPEERRLMGWFAEACAEHFGFTREDQDAYAAESLRRARQAMETGYFGTETVAVTVHGAKGSYSLEEDEQPGRCNPARLGDLKPAFKEGGTVTAGNASPMSDGAAALLLVSGAAADREGVRPLARIAGHASHAQAPAEFTTAPQGAVRRLLERLDWRADEVDLYEINEAFASIALAAIHELELDPQRVNVNGGACALGHPIGATGARILVTLVHALRQRGLRRGVATLCIGGGEATAVALELT